MWRIRNIYHSICNLLYYFKTVWNDRDWDHCYLEYLILDKMKKMQEHLKKYSNAAPLPSNKEYWDSIKGLRICINILERRKNDWYIDVWHNHFGKYMTLGFMDSDKPGHKRLDISYTGQQDLSYADMNDELEKRDWKVYCKLLEKYNNYWWD